jgi:cell division protein FtsB
VVVIDTLDCLRRQLAARDAEIERLRELVRALDHHVALLDDEMERSEYDDEDVPADVVAAEKAVGAARKAAEQAGGGA